MTSRPLEDYIMICRIGRPFPIAIAPILVAAALGCADEIQSPTPPDAEPAMAAATAQLSFRQISGGWSHSCGVTTDDRAYCWGFNGDGELGDGTTTAHLTPVPVAGGLRFQQVSAGLNFSCGVTTGNQAYCWGVNFDGELGSGASQNQSTTPTSVAGAHSFRQVAAGSFYACGVTTKNVAYCWGANYQGELGDGTSGATSPTPVAVAGGRFFRQISAGFEHTCAVTPSNTAYCWGTGYLGNGPYSTHTTPVRVQGSGGTMRLVRAGQYHSCGITSDNRAVCWGDNFRGKLGDGTETLRLLPVRVAGGRFYNDVAVDEEHSCAVTTGSIAYCWGRNRFGEVGDGTRSKRLVPAAVAGGLRFSSIRVGRHFSCGVTTASRGYCWGDNPNGELGDGTTIQRTRPTPVAGAM
jgi:alpha-tubulin suppressor-like RCC1 family protein